MSLHLITGEPGAGKSSQATLEAIAYAGRVHKTKRPVTCNWPVYDPRIAQYNTWAEVLNMRNKVVFLDETARWFGRRDHRKTGEEELAFFRQHRKYGLTIWLCAHGLEDVETKVIDELVTTITVVRRISGGPDLDEQPTEFEKKFGIWSMVRRYRAKDYLDGNVRRKIKPLSMKFFRVDKTFDLYNTWWVIGDRFGEGAGQGRELDPVISTHPLIGPEAYSLMRQWGNDTSPIAGTGSVIVRPTPEILNNTLLNLNVPQPLATVHGKKQPV